MGYLIRGKAPVAIFLAVSLALLLSAAASANGRLNRTESVNKARWTGTGQVLFIGPSPIPSAPTSATAEFKIRRDVVKSVVITTHNEFVAGVLGSPSGSAVTECKDRTDGATCATLDELLTGATVSSLHTSTTRMTNVTESTVQIALPTPAGEVIVDIPVISGDLRGKLDGVFTISKGADAATGSTSMRIKRGSTGTYACFEITDIGLLPLLSLDNCINQTGGQLLPIALDVLDRGSFEVGPGTGALSEIEKISGRVQVAAQANGLQGHFGGEITVLRSVATLSDELAPELVHKSFDDDFDKEESYEEPED